MKALGTLAAAVLIAVPCWSQPVGDGFYGSYILSAGSTYRECGSWIEYRRTPNDVREEIMKAWIWGYLSGIGSGSPIYSNVQLPSGSSVAAYMDKYCADNPLSNVIAGSTRLLKDLVKPGAR